MKLDSETYNKLVRAMECVGDGPRSYSGRGMYGKKCVGIVTDDPSDCVLAIVRELMDDCGDIDELRDLVGYLDNSSQDSMGRSAIVYWPRIEWQELDDGDNDCDHDGVLADQCANCNDEIDPKDIGTDADRIF